jgi:hypothetical protein
LIYQKKGKQKMNTKEILNKTKDYCIYEYENLLKHGGNLKNTESRCFRAVMFSLSALLEYDSPEAHELATWWDNEMYNKFKEKGAY